MVGKSKIVIRIGNRVVKQPREGYDMDCIIKQSNRLYYLGTIGFNVPIVYSDNEHQFIDGVSLSDMNCMYNADVYSALVELQNKQRQLNIYIGDLNKRNLIWANNRLYIIDCGAIRKHYSESKLTRKLDEQWSKWMGK